MAFDKIVGVDGTTYNLPDAVRTKISSNITTAGQQENTAVAAVVAAGITGKANTVHTHTVSQITDLTGIGSIPGVEIGVVGGNGIALADKHTLQYESSTSKWRNKVASGGVTVSATPPATPILGDAWFDSNDGTLYVYYSDGTSVQWVQVQANSALEGTILSRLGAVEDQTATLQTAAPITVSGVTERNSIFPSPQQGVSVFRNDLGVIERYYALYNASTNPGGATPAGWYPDKAFGVALRNVSSTLSITGGAYNNISGNTHWQTLDTAGGVAGYNNGWTIPFTGVWRVTFRVQGLPASQHYSGWRVNNTTAPGSWSFLYGGLALDATTNGGVSVATRELNSGDVLTLFAYQATTGNWPIESTIDAGSWEIEFLGPKK